MLRGDRREIEEMRAAAALRGHRLIDAEARPGEQGEPGWYTTETLDNERVRYVASGPTLAGWFEDFERASRCPAFPPRAGDGATIDALHATVCTVVAVGDFGHRIALRRDHEVRVGGGVGDGGATYRYEPDPAGATFFARWSPYDGTWMVGAHHVVWGRRPHQDWGRAQ